MLALFPSAGDLSTTLVGMGGDFLLNSWLDCCFSYGFCAGFFIYL